MSSPTIEDNALARDQAGNLNALRWSVGNETGERAPVGEWLVMQPRTARGMDHRGPLSPDQAGLSDGPARRLSDQA